MAVNMEQVEAFVARDHGLAIVSVVRADGTPASSLVNAGAFDHPLTGARTVGFVVRGDARKVVHLRAHPFASLVWRDRWSWVGVAGPVELVGPDDAVDGIDADGLRLLLRRVFEGAGGTHGNWDAYDATMLTERRLAVLVTPQRLSGNPNV
jgi:PPOX class probable F420-dependent enzyme